MRDPGSEVEHKLLREGDKTWRIIPLTETSRCMVFTESSLAIKSLLPVDQEEKQRTDDIELHVISKIPRPAKTL